MNGRTVDGLVSVPDREFFRNAEGLAVSNHHADDPVVGRNPAVHKSVHAHARQADLALGSVRVFDRKRGQLLLMGSPAEFRSRGSFLAESLDAPGVDEFVHFLGLVGDLSVSLAAMDDLNAQFMGEVIEALVARMRGDALGRLAREFLFLKAAGGDIKQRLFGEVADQTRVGTVFKNGGRSRFRPSRLHAAQVHMPPVEGQFCGMRSLGVLVGVPEFDRGVHVQNAVIMAPGDDLAAIDVPGQVDQEIPLGEMLAENSGKILGRDPDVLEMDSLRSPWLESLLVGVEVEDRDFVQRHLDMLQKDGKSASGNSAEAEKYDTVTEGQFVTHFYWTLKLSQVE